MEGKAFIWDLDGTLLDSYSVIMDNVMAVLEAAGETTDRATVHEKVIATSIGGYMHEICIKRGLPENSLFEEYGTLSKSGVEKIRLMPFAKEALEAVKAAGHRNYVYTHRGRTTEFVLKNNGIYELFEDILTSEMDLPRKPYPDGIDYLVEKHGLDKTKTYYVGDRRIDMECAANAGVKGIFYLDETAPLKEEVPADHCIKNLKDVVTVTENP